MSYFFYLSRLPWNKNVSLPDRTEKESGNNRGNSSPLCPWCLFSASLACWSRWTRHTDPLICFLCILKRCFNSHLGRKGDTEAGLPLKLLNSTDEVWLKLKPKPRCLCVHLQSFTLSHKQMLWQCAIQKTCMQNNTHARVSHHLCVCVLSKSSPWNFRASFTLWPLQCTAEHTVANTGWTRLKRALGTSGKP